MKNVKMLLGSLALAAILGVNGYMALGSSKASSLLTLDGVENVAEGEGVEIDGKGAPEYYPCEIYKYVYFDAEGKYQLPDGSYVSGQRCSWEFRTLKFNAVNCGGAVKAWCKRIKCK